MHINQADPTLNLSILQSRFFAVLVSVAVFLSISTNLRISGLPVGIGEIGLLLLMVGSLFLKPWQRLTSPLFLFWLAVWFCTGLGYLFGNVVGNLRLHNAVAYAYTGLLTLAFVAVFSRLNVQDLRRVLFYFVMISVLALGLGFLAYLTLNPVLLEWLRIDTSDNGRYQGWCQNANQMSLLLVPMPFIVLDLWATSSKKTNWYKLGWVVLLLLTVILGFVVRSAALTLSWVFGLGIIGFFSLKDNHRFNWKTIVVVLGIFAIGFIAVRGLTQQGILGTSEKNNALQVGIGTAEDKVDIRIQLWKNAVRVWGVSPVFGHGPGAYSKFDMGDASFTGMEAHNTLIDLMVQGGVLLGIAYIGFFIWLTSTLWRTNQAILLASVIVLFSFEFFMFHLRQPVLWFYFVLVSIWAQHRSHGPRL